MLNSSASAAATMLASYGPSVGVGGKAGLGIAAAMAGGGRMTSAQIDKAAGDFESMFISQMLEPMFGDSVGDAAFGSSESSDVYKGLMMDVYGKAIARSGGIGIASYVKKELLALQEVK